MSKHLKIYKTGLKERENMRFQKKEKPQVSKLNPEVGADIGVTDRYFKPVRSRA